MDTAQREFQFDGTDELAKRACTRLWYRQASGTEPGQSPGGSMALGKSGSGVRVPGSQPDRSHGTDRLIREAVQTSRALSELQEMLTAAEAVVNEPVPLDSVSALTEWRNTPTHCPVLLLSASRILDARNPGPILGPGTRYRILDVTDGVVSLQVAGLDATVAAGFCNVGDFTCIDHDIAYHRRDRQSGRLGSARLGLTKISQRLSGVTSSLIG
jgi:hypothetical protein